MDEEELAGTTLVGIGRDAGWTVLSLLASSGAYVLLTAFSVRTLGKSAFGVFALLVAASGFLAVVDFGLGLTITREAAQTRSSKSAEQLLEVQERVHAGNRAFAGLGAMVFMLFVGAVLFLPDLGGVSKETLVATALLMALGLSVSLTTGAWPAVAMGTGMFKQVAIASVGGSAANVAVVILTVDMFGLASLGLGQLTSVVVSRSLLGWHLVRALPWFKLIPGRGRKGLAIQVGRLSVPLILLGAAGRLIDLTDLVVVTALFSSSVAGSYRLGSVLPAQAVALLYRGYDVSFPRLAASKDLDQLEALGLLSKVACFLGGVGFTLMILMRRDIISILSGGRDPLAESVLLIFGLVWLANIPAHGISLMLIARGLQSPLSRIVIAEAAVNMLLTLLIARKVGPIGPALATLLTLALSNLVVLPIMFKHEFSGQTSRLMIRSGLVPTLAGAVCAAGSLIAASFDSAALRLGLGTSASIVLATGGLALVGQRDRARLKGMFFR